MAKSQRTLLKRKAEQAIRAVETANKYIAEIGSAHAQAKSELTEDVEGVYLLGLNYKEILEKLLTKL